jgi:hypothetical protein
MGQIFLPVSIYFKVCFSLYILMMPNWTSHLTPKYRNISNEAIPSLFNLNESPPPPKFPQKHKYGIINIIFQALLLMKKYAISLQRRGLCTQSTRLPPISQTSCLEGFNSVLNHFFPKMIHYSFPRMYCRYNVTSLMVTVPYLTHSPTGLTTACLQARW